MTTALHATKSEVFAVPQVPYTKSWHPIHHREVISSVEVALEGLGLGIREQSFSLTKNGLDMFGVMHLDAGPDRAPWAIGVRNSMDKHFPAGIVGGNRVVVCSNLQFAGEIKFTRRHTNGLTSSTLQAMAHGAVEHMVTKLGELDTWFGNLEKYQLTYDTFKRLTYDLINSGAVAPSNFKAFTKAMREEIDLHHRSFDSVEQLPTLIDAHGAVTRTLRGSSLFNVSARSNSLNSVIRSYQNSPELVKTLQ